MDFDKLKKLWEERGFEIVLGLCVAFLIIFGLWRKLTGKKGTWSSNYTYAQPMSQAPAARAPPRESKGELECRNVLESLFGKSFAKARPGFLNNPVTGGHHNLELDCFNPDLRLACEYNGVQHYQYVPYFHRNKEAFRNQQYRDFMKATMCKENGVTLITVPHTVDVGLIRGYLMKELQKLGYNV